MRGYLINSVYHKHEDEKQKLKMGGGSWTINLNEVKPYEVKKFIYHTKKYDYEIDSDNAVSRGWRLVFKDEPKLVVPEKHWKKTRRK